MRKIAYLWYVVTIMICLCGCNIRDAAVVIPVEENATAPLLISEEREDAEVSCQMIYVYVCGAVTNPGVYEMPEGSRADAALKAAGGLTEESAKEYVNLAAKLTDGERLYFPTAIEAEEEAAAAQAAAKGIVNINTAGPDELMELPGIGEAKAEDIVAYREKYGNFQNKEDLMKVPGIKENLYVKLCDRIIVQ